MYSVLSKPTQQNRVVDFVERLVEVGTHAVHLHPISHSSKYKVYMLNKATFIVEPQSERAATILE